MRRRTAMVAVAVVLVFGLALTTLGVLGALRNADAFLDGTVAAPPAAPVDLPTGEIVYNDRVSVYRPPAADYVVDDPTQRVVVANEILVMFRREVTDEQARAAITAWGGTVVGRLAAVNRYEVLLPNRRTLPELKQYAAELEADPRVEIAYPNELQVLAGQFQPGDEGWKSDWNGATTMDGNWGMEAINAPQLWDHRDQISAGLGATKVGIIDEGFYGNNDVSVDVLAPNKERNHGTHVAGTIAARFDNGMGVAGVIPAEITMFGFSVQGFDETNPAFTLPERFRSVYDDGMYCLNVAQQELALTYLVAERRVRVVNFSMGYRGLSPYAASHGNQKAIEAYQDTARTHRHLVSRLLGEHDFLLVAAAGNENRVRTAWLNRDSERMWVRDDSAEFGFRTPKDEEVESAQGGNVEAAFASPYTFVGSEHDSLPDDAAKAMAARVRQHIIVVGAAELREGAMSTAEYSQDGERVDIKAPGSGIESTWGEGEASGGTRDCGSVTCGTDDGTSMATPHVTGAAASLWAMAPTKKATEIRQFLLDTRQSSRWCETCFLDVGAAATKLAAEIRTTPGAPGEDPGNGRTTMTLVFDSSGSMSEDSGRTTTVDLGNGKTETEPISKADAAKEAGRVLLGTIRSSAERSSTELAVGVVEFSSSAREAVKPTTRYDEVGAAIEKLEPSGGTDLLEAIRVGTNQVSGRPGRRTVMLLTDGKDESGNSDDELLAAARLARSASIKICTVGFGRGSEINESLLKQVATTTGCSYSYADASSSVDLVGSFLGAQLQATATLLGQQVGTVTHGTTTAAIPLAVPNQTGELTTLLYWPGSALEPVLTDPEGQRVDATYPGAMFDTRQIPTQVVITDPRPGAWTLAIHGREVSMPQEPYWVGVGFRPIEREYPLNPVPQLAAPRTPPPAVTAPDGRMVIAATCLGAGPFLTILGLVLLSGLVGRRPVG